MLLEEGKISLLERMLGDCSRAVIALHSHPDGDALGSGIALRHYLLGRGMEVSLLIPDTLPETLAFLTEGEALIDAEHAPEAAAASLEGCELLFALDMNSFARAEAMETALRACKARHKVLIDHHLNPEVRDFDLVFSMTGISSASELLFWILNSMEGGIEAIPQRSRYALMTGMTTDTNNFANSVYPSTLQMASLLLEAGVDRDDIIMHLYQEYGENRIRAFSALLGEEMKIFPGGVACIVSTKAFQRKYPLRQGETEGLVNIPLGIGAVKISLFLKQDEGHFRVSIRSKRGWSANGLAKAYFNGGGHAQAAGGKLYYPQDIADEKDVYKYVETAVAQFLQTDSEQ